MTHLKPLRRALLGLAVLALAACEISEAPVQPVAQNAVGPKTVNGVTFVPARPGSGLTLANQAVVRINGKSGATITSDDASLEIVPGSLSQPNQTITMEAVNDGYVTFKFGPSGLEFDPAATLTISADKADLSGIDPSDLAIAGASDSADDWQMLGGSYDSATNTVTVEIHHFSRYALCVR